LIIHIHTGQIKEAKGAGVEPNIKGAGPGPPLPRSSYVQASFTDMSLTEIYEAFACLMQMSIAFDDALSPCGLASGRASP